MKLASLGSCEGALAVTQCGHFDQVGIDAITLSTVPLRLTGFYCHPSTRYSLGMNVAKGCWHFRSSILRSGGLWLRHDECFVAESCVHRKDFFPSTAKKCLRHVLCTNGFGPFCYGPGMLSLGSGPTALIPAHQGSTVRIRAVFSSLFSVPVTFDNFLSFCSKWSKFCICSK